MAETEAIMKSGLRTRPERISLACCVCFFLVFAFLDGPFLEADSDSYIHMGMQREAGYPLFLLFCRLLPGASRLLYEGYAGLYHAVFLQSLLWAYAVYRLFVLFRELGFKLFRKGGMANMAGWMAVLLQFAVCLIHRFLSGRGAMYSTSVLSESLAMPLYLLFTVRLFLLLRDGTRRDLVLCTFEALLLLIVRKHMVVALLLWGFAAFVLHLVIRRTRDIRRFLLQCALIVLVFAVSSFGERAYNLARHGRFMPRAGGSEGLLCMLLYTANEADATLFTEAEDTQRTWFAEIAAWQTEHGARFDDAPKKDGWRARYSYFAHSYDPVGYGPVHGVLMRAAEDMTGKDAPYLDRLLAMYNAEAELVPPLLRQDKRDLFAVYADNLIAGLTASNAKISNALFPVSMLLYAAYLTLFVLCARKPDAPANALKNGDLTITPRGQLLLLAFLVLAGILINSGFVAAIVFSQARYNTYGMALFYTLLVVMGIYQLKAKGNGDDSR